MRKYRDGVVTALLIILLLIISCKIMLTTLQYDGDRYLIKPTTKVWSDFTSNIPLIRSFSLGDNFTRLKHGQFPEYPIFPGEPIKYHFLFFMFVALLEKIGLRIDWALNIPSILGFFLLNLMVYLFSKKIFNSIWVGVLSVIFLLFNGAFAFIEFFKVNPISLQTPNDILTNKLFWGLAPWAEGTIASSMWNLNIFTNQRHLGLAFGLVVLFSFTALILESKKWREQRRYAIIWGLVLGIFPYLHQPALLILGVTIICYWLTIPTLRKYLFYIGLLSSFLVLPQLFGIQHGTSLINWRPGFIIRPPLSIYNIIIFWWQNFGFHSVLIPFGYALATIKVKKFLLPLFIIFIIGSLVTFSPDPATNHKFFNYSLIMGGMLSAFILVTFIKSVHNIRFLPIRITGYICSLCVFLFLTLSGIIDYFAVINDYWIPIPDVKAHPLNSWVIENISPDSVILNSSFFASYPVTGRKIFLGWPYFSWSAGYDVPVRQKALRTILEARSVQEQCDLIIRYRIAYMIIEYPPQEPKEFIPNYSIFSNHGKTIYQVEHNSVSYSIYDTKSYCLE